MNNSTKQLTAIVVDDDHNTVSVFSEFLELEGIKVIGKGYDGFEAVKLYANLKPDVTFLDVMMKKCDGIIALEEIKKINRDAVVIMVTADLRMDTEEKLERGNATAIVFKPFDIDHLMNTVKRYCLPNEKPLSPEICNSFSTKAMN